MQNDILYIVPLYVVDSQHKRYVDLLICGLYIHYIHFITLMKSAHIYCSQHFDIEQNH